MGLKVRVSPTAGEVWGDNKLRDPAVCGTGVAHVFVVWSFEDVVHFSGVGWKSVREETQLTNRFYTAVTVKGNLAIAVGIDGRRAAIAIRRRMR